MTHTAADTGTRTPGATATEAAAPPWRRRSGTALAALLAVDGLAHLYWATGRTWPAVDERALSLAVLGMQGVSFAPPVVLPLAALTLTGAAAVLAHAHGRGGRPTRLVTAAVATGLAVRGLAGLGWAAGLLDTPPDSPFATLNLALYTPACLGFGWAAARLARAR
ncbi:DUF3995 domain-containing protein [Streptomyces sp. NBC_00503]|uniref:DUF3995 domain-containing protein n=1 Tax=Streptomyces sp. NBC_00503 TaxID=2903659 RepID=UPI002E808CB5|nr:DUF3995 domain-containing protein [Streptomyces sp. NBC_00503]WUD82912.1 DUF3995 domain-containing protein [Streptomyces sp. NBC_00503]